VFLMGVPTTLQQTQIETSLASIYGITLQNPLAGGSATASNAASPLTTPTYDTSGQAVHPDIIDAGAGNAILGHRFWMSLTPYPGGNDDYENPSILVSEDGDTWVVPDGLTNPIVAAPSNPVFNADSDLILGQDGKLYCFYMTSDGSTYSKSWVTSSTNGVIWSAPALLFTAAYLGFVSPSVIWDGSQYVMWYTDVSTSPYKLYHRTCATPDGTWSAPVRVSITPPVGYDVWHLDVLVDGTDYYAFLTCCTAGTAGSASRLFPAKSTDAGLTFLFYATTPMITTSASGWDDKQIYRTTGVRTAGGFTIWYSGANISDVWHIGKTDVTLA
jgi:hypothetical protein